ncbi:YncE family protein [Streptomyces sp. NBC_00083]|uniref:YncE family protein n=1 Tax=Streptomyces sp. NBC_00083 TaxID=2975647 RepID=UPI00224F9D48|nr:YncE family protein [Streptomyces sp. NBC_00083]MCX5387502.1 YncE family protein [Streptomyces sp. NBC_00083]
MAVFVISADTASGSLTVTEKVGPSSYRRPVSVVTGRGPLGVAQCGPGGMLFVALAVCDEVFSVDVATGQVVGRIRVGWAPRSLTPVPGTPYLLVANAGSDTVSVIDTGEGRVTTSIKVGREPGAMAVSADGRTALVCERGEGTVGALDLSPLVKGRPARISLRWRTGLGPHPHVQPRAVALCGGGAVVACARRDALPVLNVDDGVLVADVALPVPGSAPVGVAVTGGDGFALVALERAGLLAVVDLLDWRVTRQIRIGPGPRHLAIDADDGTVYCTLAPDSRLAVLHLDGVDLSTTDGEPQFDTLATGTRPSAVAVVRINELALNGT